MITFSKRVLRLLLPTEEAQRMDMRRTRCVAEAGAEDLSRTIAIHHDAIVAAITKGKAASDERQQRRTGDPAEKC
jgi:hypothetical protein